MPSNPDGPRKVSGPESRSQATHDIACPVHSSHGTAWPPILPPLAPLPASHKAALSGISIVAPSLFMSLAVYEHVCEQTEVDTPSPHWSGEIRSTSTAGRGNQLATKSLSVCPPQAGATACMMRVLDNGFAFD
ncbi:hypothetical protein Cob_v004815 [Colletotrichum orbiculare MAFF 240422]|uniref:Uncharacterized protein n=1 Tax=Colletotrichum orbiculare (strain 104-T / ATCC 96160 / CBS 514.97 / LARS 414 / MAFF 240422) TaxID=1213857 RepID=A0A484FW33_COLOR|nr:hypothetical protein Cob_v004815 [Colletotrichum orbiculare MAFF 240422]